MKYFFLGDIFKKVLIPFLLISLLGCKHSDKTLEKSLDKSYSEILYDESIGKFGEEIQVLKNYDAFTDKISCSINFYNNRIYNEITFTPYLYSIDIKEKFKRIDYKFDNNKILTFQEKKEKKDFNIKSFLNNYPELVKTEDLNKIQKANDKYKLKERLIPYSTWSKYGKLSLRYYDKSRKYDYIFDLSKLKKAVDIHIACKGSKK